MTFVAAPTKWTIAALVILHASLPASAQRVSAPGLEAQQRFLGTRIVGSPYFNPVTQISPDGRWIVTQLRVPRLSENRYEIDLWLIDPRGQHQPRRLTHLPAQPGYFSALLPRWSPDSRTIAFAPPEGGLRLFDLTSNRTKSLLAPTSVQGVALRFELGSFGDYKWSPDGRLIAFLATVDRSPPPNPDRGTEQRAPTLGQRHTTLFTVDLSTMQVEAVTDSLTNVHSFDWSPDGRRFVIAAGYDTRFPHLSYMSTDLFILKRGSTDLIPLVRQAGRDSDPLWSPDGGTIAFQSQWGTLDWYQMGKPAIVDATGGPVRRLAETFVDSIGPSFFQMRWGTDSRRLYMTYSYHMHQAILAVPASGAAVWMVTPNDSAWYSDFDIAPSTGEMTFVRQTVTSPPDIDIMRLDDPTLHRITDFNPGLAAHAVPRVMQLAWRSSDGRWNVDGVLVAPPNYRAGERYPVLMDLFGGPSMLNMKYGLDSQYCILCYANDGFVVFAPNTRARNGYGEAFLHASEMDGTAGSGHVKDAMPGIDELIRRGIADSLRMGIMGMSYGGYLTAYFVTQTNRFRAAMYNEGIFDLVDAARPGADRMEGGPVERALRGAASPYIATELQQMMRESPAYNMRSFDTPILLEYGAASGHASEAPKFSAALRAFGVPNQVVTYPRTGHGIIELSLLMDSYRRQRAWVRYWLLDEAYPDSIRQQAYDAWRAERRRMGDPRWQETNSRIR